MTTEITSIKQSDGSVRVIHAQDAEHAARARSILRNDPAMVAHLDGVDGIETRWVSAMGLDPTPKAEQKLTIPMSERRPLKIVKSEWPKIAHGSAFSGQHEFQAFDGARISVRRHADGRTVVYGYAGDWDGGGRPTRENRTAGFLLASDDDDVVRAIRRVAGILAETECVGEMAEEAGRGCIADLPAEDDDGRVGDTRTVSMPLDGANRLVDLLDRVHGCLRADPTGWTIDGSDRETLRAATEDLRRVVTARMAQG